MIKSSLTDVTILNDHYSSRYGNKIDKITIHHIAGNLSAETCGNVFKTRQASTNYGIDSNGKVGCYVSEEYRAWSTANPANDRRAINIELANDEIGGNWHVSDTAINKCIDLCVDICQRNGISKLNYTGDTNGNLTRHNMFMATTCPGPYLQSKFSYIADEVNKRLGGDTPTPSNKIAEDGVWGKETTKKAQKVFGTTIDGIISNQYKMYASKNPGLSSTTFEWVTKPSYGSNLIKAIQAKVGSRVDGFIGNDTIRCMQKWLGTIQDGYVSKPSNMVKAFQKWLNEVD